MHNTEIRLVIGPENILFVCVCGGGGGGGGAGVQFSVRKFYRLGQ